MADKFQRLESKVESSFQKLADRIEAIEAYGQSYDPATDSKTGTIKSFGDGYHKELLTLIQQHWNKNPDSSSRTTQQAKDVREVVLGDIKIMGELVKDDMFEEGKEKSFSNMLKPAKIKLIKSIEKRVATRHVYLNHCNNSWLTKRIIGRVLLNTKEKGKVQSKEKGKEV
jgi:hypothetical protein